MLQLLQIQVFFVFLLANCHHVRSLEFKNCEGELDGCCNGFMYNKTLGECTECRIGYFGPMCTISCPYNSYGRGCQMECSCLEDDCNFAMGCENNDSAQLTSAQTTDGISRTTQVTKHNVTKQSVVIYVIIGLVFILGLMIIAHVVLHLAQKQSK